MTKTLEERVADLELTVAGLIETLVGPEGETPVEAVDPVHEKFLLFVRRCRAKEAGREV